MSLSGAPASSCPTSPRSSEGQVSSDPQLITDAKALRLIPSSGHQFISDRQQAQPRDPCDGGKNAGHWWVPSVGLLSAGALLAARLGHGRVKLTWDPSYTVAKQAQDQSREPQGHRGESDDGRVGTAGT